MSENLQTSTEITVPMRSEMHSYTERQVSLSLYFARPYAKRVLFDDMFDKIIEPMQEELAALPIIFDDAKSKRYVQVAAQAMINDSPRIESAQRLVRGGLKCKYGLNDDEIEQLLKEKIQEELQMRHNTNTSEGEEE